MNSAELKNKISDLRPNYSDKYRSMIETISNKQEKLVKVILLSLALISRRSCMHV